VNGPAVARAVLAKDLLLDFRTRDRLGHMAVFALLVVALLSIVLPASRIERLAWSPALLWVVLLFTSLLGLARSFQSETEGGALGLAALGTLLSAMSVAVRFREFLLPVLLFPLVLPVLVLASRITGEALAGREVPGLWWAAFALYDWVFALIGYFVFDYVLED